MEIEDEGEGWAHFDVSLKTLVRPLIETLDLFQCGIYVRIDPGNDQH
jgi:hypothetical protein